MTPQGTQQQQQESNLSNQTHQALKQRQKQTVITNNQTSTHHQQLAIYLNGKLRSNSIFQRSTSGFSFGSLLGKLNLTATASNSSEAVGGKSLVCGATGQATTRSSSRRSSNASRASDNSLVEFGQQITGGKSTTNRKLAACCFPKLNPSSGIHANKTRQQTAINNNKQQQHQSFKLNPSSMFLRKAMRYYRLWIYGANLSILIGALIFVCASLFVFTDTNIKALILTENDDDDDNVEDQLKLTQSQKTQVPSELSVKLAKSEPIMLLAYAALAFQLGLLQSIGCYAAIKMKEKCIKAFWYLILALIFFDVCFLLYAMSRFTKITNNIDKNLNFRLKHSYGLKMIQNSEQENHLKLADDQNFTSPMLPIHQDPFSLTVDRMQSHARCCGIDGAADYHESAWRRLVLNQLITRGRADQTTHSQFNLIRFVPLSCCYEPLQTNIDDWNNKLAAFSSEDGKQVLTASQLLRSHRRGQSAWAPAMIVEELDSGHGGGDALAKAAKPALERPPSGDGFSIDPCNQQLKGSAPWCRERRSAYTSSDTSETITSIKDEKSTAKASRLSSSSSSSNSNTMPNHNHQVLARHLMVETGSASVDHSSSSDSNDENSSGNRDAVTKLAKELRQLGACALNSYYSPKSLLLEPQMQLRSARGCKRHARAVVSSRAHILFVAGFCVLTVVKFCALVLLRLEIREMIHKIRVLKGMVTEYSALHDLEAYLPRASLSTQTATGICSSANAPVLSGAVEAALEHQTCHAQQQHQSGSFSEAVAAASAQAIGASLAARASSMKALAHVSSMLSPTPSIYPRSSSTASAHLHAIAMLSQRLECGSSPVGQSSATMGGAAAAAAAAAEALYQASGAAGSCRRHTAVSMFPSQRRNTNVTALCGPLLACQANLSPFALTQQRRKFSMAVGFPTTAATSLATPSIQPGNSGVGAAPTDRQLLGFELASNQQQSQASNECLPASTPPTPTPTPTQAAIELRHNQASRANSNEFEDEGVAFDKAKPKISAPNRSTHLSATNRSLDVPSEEKLSESSLPLSGGNQSRCEIRRSIH